MNNNYLKTSKLGNLYNKSKYILKSRNNWKHLHLYHNDVIAVYINNAEVLYSLNRYTGECIDLLDNTIIDQLYYIYPNTLLPTNIDIHYCYCFMDELTREWNISTTLPIFDTVVNNWVYTDLNYINISKIFDIYDDVNKHSRGTLHQLINYRDVGYEWKRYLYNSTTDCYDLYMLDKINCQHHHHHHNCCGRYHGNYHHIVNTALCNTCHPTYHIHQHNEYPVHEPYENHHLHDGLCNNIIIRNHPDHHHIHGNLDDNHVHDGSFLNMYKKVCTEDHHHDCRCV